MYDPKLIYGVVALSLSILLTAHSEDRAALVLEEPVVSARFKALGWVKTLRDVYYFERANEPIKMLIPSGGLSIEYNYRGPETLRFYLKETDAQGAVRWNPVGSVRLTSASSEYLLLFRAAENKNGFQVRAEPNSVADFPGGSYRFFNFTSAPIAGKLESSEFVVGPGATTTVKPEPGPGASLVTFLATRTGGNWKVLFKTKWPWKKDVQTLVFLVPGDREGQVRQRIIRERLLSNSSDAR